MDKRNPFRSLKLQNDLLQAVEKHQNKNVLWIKLMRIIHWQMTHIEYIQWNNFGSSIS